MLTKTFTAIAASLALAATPVAAQTAPVDRAPATIEQGADMFEGGGPSLIILLLASAAVIAAVIVAAGGDDNTSLPTSP